MKYTRPPDKRDLFIAIPHVGTVSWGWAQKYKHLDMPPGVSFADMGLQGQPIQNARNVAVTYALQHDARHLFFIDSDILLKHDTLTKLYERRKPVIGAAYCSRAPPYNFVANINRQALSPAEYIGKEMIIDVEELGMGACLIDMRVIFRMMERFDMFFRCSTLHKKEIPNKTGVAKFPWKEAQEYNWKCKYCQNGLISEFFDYTIATGRADDVGMYSEDYYFCRNVIATGGTVSVHTGAFVTHEISMQLVEQGIYNPVTSAHVI